jgi:hypothetical protein
VHSACDKSTAAISPGLPDDDDREGQSCRLVQESLETRDRDSCQSISAFTYHGATHSTNLCSLHIIDHTCGKQNAEAVR